MVILSENPTLNEFIEEAQVNYQASRFADAAGTYAHLSREFHNSNFMIDALYFQYASIASWARANNNEHTLRSITKLITQATEAVRNLSMQYVSSSDDIQQQNIYMEIALDIMKHTNNQEITKKYAQSLLNNYILMSNDGQIETALQKSSLSIELQEGFIRRIIELHHFLKLPREKIKTWKNKLALIIEKISAGKLKSNQYQVKETAAAILVKAIQIYIELSDYLSIKRTLVEFFRINSKLSLDRFDILVESVENIDDYIAKLQDKESIKNQSPS